MKKLFIFIMGVMLSHSFLNAKGVIIDNNSTNMDTAALSGTVWWDENLNGIRDENAKGIKGIRVHLYKNGEDTGQMVFTQTEGAGSYSFENLEPDANYTVKIDLPKNYPDFTLHNKGNDASKDSDIVNWVWRSSSVYLKKGQRGILDAGLICKVCAQLHLEKRTNGVLVQKRTDIPKIKVADKVTWKYTVYNDSTKSTIKNIKVTDDKEGNITCPKSSLEPGEYMNCYKEGTAKEGLYTNIATVTGEGADKNLTDEYPSNYYGAIAKIDLEKLTNGKDSDTAPGESLSVGDKVEWEYIVTNTGNVKLTDIKVADDKEGAINCPKTELDVNETMTCVKEGIVKEGQYTNTATVTANSEAGETIKDSDPSNYTGVTACLGNYMWLDKNLNGVQDSNEPGVVGIKVDLYDENGKHLATTRTDKEGKYKFCSLKAGKYRVKFQQPNTYMFTIKDEGSDIRDSDVNSKGWSQIIQLKNGEQNMTIDAGIYCSCDDYKVHPQNYKKLDANTLFAAPFVFIIFLLSSAFYKKEEN